jgi:hypothetical protein|tara:strand:+ start:222 stop:407 length:186 start_codon:yes stop_codon:yes gene_type:complete
MQFIRNTSMSKKKSFLILSIKIILFFVVIFVSVMLLNKIDLPLPSKDIEKIIPNEKLRIVK